MHQSAMQRALELGKLDVSFEFEPSILNCERTNTARSKLAQLMHWLRKLHEKPPEPLQCDYMGLLKIVEKLPLH
ncbi:hypothetical protein AWZ03_002614 [Drosophila navojoa]|uniref:Uncharacterized protein n=1 Tax=Drosophila navojoa TaxID=7232 RepID=A0A484BQ65_DRONA|nr:hypothetical protein AWZ03_002614 [Drosophila navojoa]